METVQQATEQVTLLQDRIVALESRLAVATREHQADIDLIGESAIELANTKNWCHEYDEFVNELNRKLNRRLPTREVDYVVTIMVRVDVTATPQDISDIASTISSEIEQVSLSDGTIGYADIHDYEEV